MNSIRQHIIDLIRQYIYTNGAQKITGAQLQEILLEIANAFALNGGIDTVLATGSTVSNGRVITNEKNGTFRLEAEQLAGERVLKYIGLDIFQPTVVTAAYVGSDFVSTGIIKRRDASRSIFQMLAGGLEKGEIAAFTSHSLDEESPREGDPVTKGSFAAAAEPTLNAEINSAVRAVGGGAHDRVRLDSIENQVKNGDDVADQRITAWGIDSMVYTPMDSFTNSSIRQSRYEISHVVQSGPQTSSHFQRGMNIETRVENGLDLGSTATLDFFGAYWRNYSGDIARMDNSGVGIASDRRLTLSKNGAAPTAGLAKLASGTVNVATSAVRANSVISLTVQEGGTYAGRIRVASKIEKAGFSISSSNDTDNCNVFWQIIDLD